MKSIIVTEENQEERLDKLLTNKLPEKSRSQWQKAIKAGLVFVNDEKVTPHYFLKINDQITIQHEEKVEKISKGFKLNIVHETDDFLIINKPAGLTVHPANEDYPEETLVDLLLKKYPTINEVGEDKLRPGIIHRLDKDVSGLMVIAKNNKIFNHLKKQFQKRTVKKEYLALVHGQLSQPEGTIDFPIDYAADDSGKMAARPKSQSGKAALTEYEVIEEIKNYSLLKVSIKTGRTHQIRVHLNALGHPVVGDNVYCPPKMKIKNIGRLFLHASLLGFKSIANEESIFSSKMPVGLEEVLEVIKK